MYDARIINYIVKGSGGIQVEVRYYNKVFTHDKSFTVRNIDDAISVIQTDLAQFNIDHANDRNELLPTERIDAINEVVLD